ncbi:MAG: hypothetical protein H6531_05185 [Actinobacteria bacterium]|nr:hypothetical protein [Actinomycetota bacterium]
MRSAAWLALVAVIVAVLAGGAPTARGAVSDEAELVQALSVRDVYASRSALGTLAPVVEDRLALRALELAERSQPVKLGIVSSFGGEDPFAFADRVRNDLDFDGTVLVTTPHGAVGASGPRSPGSVQGAFKARDVDNIASATQRLITAAGLAVPPPPDPDPAPRGLLTLVGLTILGGIWAVTWGLRREQRRARAVVADRRALLRLAFDGLEGQLAATVGRADLTGAEMDAAQRYLDSGREAARLGRSEDMAEAAHKLNRGCRIVFGDDAPAVANRLFAGLCAVDPSHGSAMGLSRIPGRELPAPVCDACRARVDSGDPPTRRTVPLDGRPVIWDDIPVEMLLTLAGLDAEPPPDDLPPSQAPPSTSATS